ncbi:hypothetical protein HanPI659440_Chr11g0433871 [Helianthus annuus]|nr:hypothetical protein HanPI659440_Chr11g0433871 [Helianthus annuus]
MVLLVETGCLLVLQSLQNMQLSAIAYIYFQLKTSRRLIMLSWWFQLFLRMI